MLDIDFRHPEFYAAYPAGIIILFFDAEKLIRILNNKWCFLITKALPYTIEIKQNYSGSSSSPFSSSSFQLFFGNRFWKMNTSQAHIHRTAPTFQSMKGTPTRRRRIIAANIFLAVRDITFYSNCKTLYISEASANLSA